MSTIEIAAFIFGVANIILIIRRSVWNFPFAIAMVGLYAKIFYEQKLYSDAALQIFFIFVNIYGWWSWHRNRQAAGEILVERMGKTALAYWIGGSVVAVLLWGWFMRTNTDASFPFWDAAIAMLSVVGQILMTRRYLENWHWWIVVNIISIPVYLLKGLHLTAGLYAIFLVLAIAGFVEWRSKSGKLSAQ
jgi:nicotinamide mononucleotide transporter